MARAKNQNKFLNAEECQNFEQKMIEKRGKTGYTRFVAEEIAGTAYQTMRAKFASKKVEIVIKNNADRFFENIELRAEVSELRNRLEKAREGLR